MNKITLDRTDGIWVVTLNVPEKLNTISVEMSYRLAEISAAARTDPDIRALVITGNGRAFCAGGNLRPSEGVYDHDSEESMNELLRGYYDRCLGFRTLPVPTIAAINGYALGAGLCLAMACDIRFAADNAKLGFNFARLALHPGMGASWLLTRALGHARASELLFSGDLFKAPRALELGLVNAVFGADEFMERTMAWVRRAASGSLPVIRSTKATLLEASELNWDQLLDREAAEQSHCFGTRDFGEGIQAVFQKREPSFEDR